MKNKFRIGELVYVPSDVMLFNESDTHKLKKPTNLLIMGEKENCYEVLFNGVSWYIKNDSIYKLKEKIC